jgi:hypothetical protein
MSLKEQYLNALAGDDVDIMMDAGLTYYKALNHPDESLPDTISADIRHFFIEPIGVKKEYLALLQLVTDGKLSAEEFVKIAPRIDVS